METSRADFLFASESKPSAVCCPDQRKLVTTLSLFCVCHSLNQQARHRHTHTSNFLPHVFYFISPSASSEPLNFTWRTDCRSHQMGGRVGCQVGFSHGNAQIHLLVKGFWHQTDPSEFCLHLKVEERLHLHPDYGAGVQRSRVKVWLLKHPKHFFPAVIAGLLLFAAQQYNKIALHRMHML